MTYPISAGIELSVDGSNWYQITDHNREPIQATPEIIENVSRMANGKMRKYVVSKKMKFNVDWSYVPTKTELTVDGNKGCAWLDAFYNANVGIPVYLKVNSSKLDIVPTPTFIKNQGTAVDNKTGKALTTENTVSIDGLSPAKKYKLYAIVEDISGNKSIVDAQYFSTQVDADITAPTVLSTSSLSLTTTKASFTFVGSEPATYHYLVYLTGVAAPTIAQIKAQGTAVAKGTGSLTEATKTITLSDLAVNTSYNVFLVLTDPSGNTTSSISTIPISTLATVDTTAPVVSDVNITSLRSTTGALSLQSSETGSYFYLVYAAATATPNASSVIVQGTAIAKGSGSITMGQSITAFMTGLTASTDYKVHIVTTDTTGVASSVYSLPFTTSGDADINIPVITESRIQSVSTNGAVYNFVSSEAGTYYLMVFDSTEGPYTPVGTAPQDGYLQTSVSAFEVYNVFITSYSSTIIHRTKTSDYAKMSIEFTEI